MLKRIQNKSVKVKLGKKRAANAKVAYSDHFSSRPYQKAKRGFKTAKITNKKVDAMCIKTALE